MMCRVHTPSFSKRAYWCGAIRSAISGNNVISHH